MDDKPSHDFRRPNWKEAGIWMGANFSGLARLYARNRFHIAPACWLDAGIDLAFAAGNSVLGIGQKVLYARRLAKTQITEPPLFILGHWRTGTTLLHELLSLDPRHRSPTTFECFTPNHFVLTERWLKPWIGFALPPNRPPDNMAMGWDLPQEDEFALCNLGVPSPYLTIAFPNHPPQCQDYFELDSLSVVDREHWKASLLTFLKQLTLMRAGRIVLKSPTHSFRIPTLHEMFPDARYVLLVRNPYEIFSSTVRLWKSLYSVHGYQTPNFAGLEEYVFATFLRMHERVEATRKLIAPNRFVEVRYEDLAAQPEVIVRQLYEHLSLGDIAPVESRLRDHLAKQIGYQRNRHDLPPDLRAEIYHRWQPYFDCYGYHE